MTEDKLDEEYKKVNGASLQREIANALGKEDVVNAKRV